MSDKTRNRVTWVLSGLLALGFLAAGSVKLFVQPAEAAAQFEAFGLPRGMAIFIALCEIAGGIGVLVPRLAGLAASGLAIIMAGAVFSHATHDPLANAIPPLVLGLVCVFVAWSRGVSLRSSTPNAA